MNKKSMSVVLMTIASTVAFFIFGYFEALKGASLSSIKETYSFSYTSIGMVMTVCNISFFISTFMSGIYVKRFKKIILSVAAILIVVSIFGMANPFKSIFLVFAGSLFLGLGLGMIELGGNFIIVDIHERNKKGKYLNIISAVYCIGAILSPILLGEFVSNQLSWENTYYIAIVLLVPVILVLFFKVYPSDESIKKSPFSYKEFFYHARTKKMIGFYVLTMLYVTCEIGMGNWLVPYLQVVKIISIENATKYLSLYYVCIAIGRFLGSVWVHKYGYMKSIILSLSVSSVLLILGIVVPSEYSFVLPIVGFSFAVVFPTIVAAVTETKEGQIQGILGLVLSFAGIGGMIGASLIGVASDIFGLKISFLIIVLFVFLALAKGIQMRKEIRN